MIEKYLPFMSKESEFDSMKIQRLLLKYCNTLIPDKSGTALLLWGGEMKKELYVDVGHLRDQTNVEKSQKDSPLKQSAKTDQSTKKLTFDIVLRQQANVFSNGMESLSIHNNYFDNSLSEVMKITYLTPKTITWINGRPVRAKLIMKNLLYRVVEGLVVRFF